MLVFVGIIVSGTVLLYLTRRWTFITLYVTVLTGVPFYWAPFDVVVLNAISLHRLFGLGILIGVFLETLGCIVGKRVNKSVLCTELMLLVMYGVWSVAFFQIGSWTSGVRQWVFILADHLAPFILMLRTVALSQKEQPIVIAKRLFQLIMWFSLGIAALTIAEYLLQQPLAWDWYGTLYKSSYEYVWTPSSRAGVLRVQATFGQSIFLGSYLVGASLLALSLTTTVTGRRRVGAYLIAAVLALAAFLPMSRGAILAELAGFGLLFVLGVPAIRLNITLGVVSFCLVITALTIAFDAPLMFWSEALATLTGTASTAVASEQLNNFDVRIYVLTNGLRLILAGPLQGYGDYNLGGVKPILDVVSVFVQVGLTSGIVGLVLFLVYFGFLIMRLVALWRLEKDGEGRTLVVGLIAFCLTTLLTFLNSSWPGQFTQFGWLMFGLATAWPINGAIRRDVPNQVVSLGIAATTTR